MSATETLSIPPEIVALEAEAAARLQALEEAEARAQAEAAARDRQALQAAVAKILATAGVSCLAPFVVLPDDIHEGDVLVRICLPEHWPISLRLVRSRDGGWESRFWVAQPDDPLAEPGQEAVWRVDRPNHYAFTVHFGTALVRARPQPDEPDEPEIPF